MPVTVKEMLEGSRDQVEGDNGAYETRWRIAGTDDDVEALTELKAVIPLTLNGLPRQNISLETGEDSTSWYAVVSYSERAEEEPGSSTFSFEIGTESAQIFTSRQTVNRYAPDGETAPNFLGAINVQGDEVQGVQILVPTYSFSETHYLAADFDIAAYKATLFALTGTVNNATFKGFAAGEVLFLGASGSTRNDGTWEISFRFSALPNEPSLTIGTIEDIVKRGWDLLWVLFKKEESEGRVVQTPTAVYVEQVYPYKDFSVLGI